MINGNEITLLFGLPGAGKTTALQSIIQATGAVRRLSGGSLISNEVSEAERDSLRKLGTDQILLNQEILIINFKKALKECTGQKVVFDGHCVIKNGQDIVEIPISVIKRMNPDQIIFFDISPSTIIVQRANDAARPDRETESLEDLEKSRFSQLEICGRYAHDLGIEFAAVLNERELQDKLIVSR